MYLPPTTFRAIFLQVQAMVLILIQPDRCLFSHLKLILLLPVCATAMRHRWLSLPLPTPQGLHLPAYGPGCPFSPPGLPTGLRGAPQDRTPFQPPRLPQHRQAFPSLACACPHPRGAGAAPVPCPCPAAGCGLGWDRLPDPAWLLLAVAHKTHSVSWKCARRCYWKHRRVSFADT